MQPPRSSGAARPTLGGFEWLLDGMLRRAVVTGTLAVGYPSGLSCVYGDGGAPKAAIRLVDGAAVRAIYLDPALRFAEMYMDGRMVIDEGGLEAFVALGKINKVRRFATPPAVALSFWRVIERGWRRHVARETAERNVKHHYDLDERLFSLFLDRDLQYSCAYFATEGMSLEEAQLAKKRHIAAKMMLRPGQRVLDIGCGWGGMALYLAGHAAADVTGVTLSTEQLRVARRRAQELGLADRARFEHLDYRAVEGTFDRIVSVGMFEHVGPQNFTSYFKTAARLLDEDGVFLLHSIGRSRPNWLDPPFLEKYIFPNGHVPALSETLRAIERSGLMVKDIEILTFHYAETLKHWRERFHARRDQVLALYDERFFRMWDLYLATSEVTFRHGRMFNFQIQLVKKQTTSRRTRDYIAEAEERLRTATSGRSYSEGGGETSPQ